MDSKTKTSFKVAPAAKEEEYEPVDGSWVAELEDAKAALEEAAATGASASKRRGELLRARLRLCRSYGMLRQWESLREAADGGSKVCASYNLKRGSSAAALRVSEWEGRFAAYREQAGRELSVPSGVEIPSCQEWLRCLLLGRSRTDGVNLRAAFGDMRFLEATVAHGAAIDVPFVALEDLPWVPSDATELVAACANIAAYDSERTMCADGAAASPLDIIDRSAECAMQLVRLGADPTRKLNLSKAPDPAEARMYRALGLDGKTALELARMTKRKELVELMEQHLRYTPEERAEVVHCRCGSRLPWKKCHGTGTGQPPHYQMDESLGVAYRLSPLARCPCDNTALAYYECCWKNASRPTYLHDVTGERTSCLGAPQQLGIFDAFVSPEHPTVPDGMTGTDMVAMYASLLRSDPDVLQTEFGQKPKSRMASWDPEVYAGCLEHLEDPDDFFVWTDLHWKVDEPELLRRTREWNKALEKYCRAAGLTGAERDRVVARHTANPCAPCGRVGCDAFENEVKEFPRCSRCKLISYCGRACQKKDWAEHRKTCVALKTAKS